MKAIFRGDPGELALGGGLSRTSIDMHGLHFQMGVPVDISHLSDAQKRKLSTNTHFEIVAEVAAPSAADSAPSAPPALEDDALAEEAAEAEAHKERAAAKRAAKAQKAE